MKNYNFETLYFSNFSNANDTLIRMRGILETYGVITVADMYNLAGVENCSYIDNKYGWYDLKGASVYSRMGLRDYTIRLPQPVQIVCHERESSSIDDYIKADIDITKRLIKQQINSVYGVPKTPYFPKIDSRIDKVIFNDPATIVFWKDGTKTVVKCGEYDIYDPEKGLAMAFVKKVLGNKGNYYNEIKKWVGEYEYEPDCESVEFEFSGETLRASLDRLSERLKDFTYGGKK